MGGGGFRTGKLGPRELVMLARQGFVTNVDVEAIRQSSINCTFDPHIKVYPSTVREGTIWLFHISGKPGSESYKIPLVLDPKAIPKGVRYNAGRIPKHFNYKLGLREKIVLKRQAPFDPPNGWHFVRNVSGIIAGLAPDKEHMARTIAAGGIAFRGEFEHRPHVVDLLVPEGWGVELKPNGKMLAFTEQVLNLPGTIGGEMSGKTRLARAFQITHLAHLIHNGTHGPQQAEVENRHSEETRFYPRGMTQFVQLALSTMAGRKESSGGHVNQEI